MRIRKLNVVEREYQKIIRKLNMGNLGLDEEAELLVQKELTIRDLKFAEFKQQQSHVERVNISKQYLC